MTKKDKPTDTVVAKSKQERIKNIISESDYCEQIDMYNKWVYDSDNGKHRVLDYDPMNLGEALYGRYSVYELLELGGSIASEAIARDMPVLDPGYFMVDEDGCIDIYWDEDEVVEKLISDCYEEMAEYALKYYADFDSSAIRQVLDGDDDDDDDDDELKKFNVVITQKETLSITVEVEAHDRDEALDIANEKYLNDEYNQEFVDEASQPYTDIDYSISITAQ